MLCTGAQIVLKSLKDLQVEYIFGYPGGAILPIYDEMTKSQTDYFVSSFSLGIIIVHITTKITGPQSFL